jgi:hypothetical protein
MIIKFLRVLAGCCAKGGTVMDSFYMSLSAPFRGKAELIVVL